MILMQYNHCAFADPGIFVSGKEGGFQTQLTEKKVLTSFFLLCLFQEKLKLKLVKVPEEGAGNIFQVGVNFFQAPPGFAHVANIHTMVCFHDTNNISHKVTYNKPGIPIVYIEGSQVIISKIIYLFL